MRRNIPTSIALGFILVSIFSYRTAVAADLPPETLKDSQIVNILVNLNNSEITVGRMAKQKGTNKDVKNFAGEMIDGHSQSNIELEKLAKDLSLKKETSDASEKLKKDSAAKAADLKKEKTPGFDSDYMDAQVAGHQDALKMIEEHLIPNAKSPQLITLLTQTKAVVQKHLDMATKIQSTLKKP
jgi:putative membrane protein